MPILKNQAAVMTAVKKLEIKDYEIPTLSPEEVMLEMAYVGICGSDAHFFESGQRKGKDFQLPFILGHEASGTVIKVGNNVTNLTVGDRVAIEPQQTCEKCFYCKSGHYNMCPDVKFPSVPPYDGMLRKYFKFPAHLCFKLPDNVSLLEGSLIEPFAIGLSAAERGEVHVGQSVVIIGMGTIGLTTLLACKARGVSKIIAIDIFQNRLECANKFGATHTINANNCDAVKEVNRITENEGGDVVFETAGNQKTAFQTEKYLKRCGTIVMVGNINGQTPFEFMNLMYKEGEIKTIYRYRNNFNTAISMVSAGKVELESMVTETYPLSQVQEAFERSIIDKQNVVKIVIDMKR